MTWWAKGFTEDAARQIVVVVHKITGKWCEYDEVVMRGPFRVTCPDGESWEQIWSRASSGEKAALQILCAAKRAPRLFSRCLPISKSELRRLSADTLAYVRSYLGMVYFAQHSNGSVKIGWSINHVRRVHQLQAGLIFAVSGTRADEARIQSRLSAHRLGGSREWFRPDEPVMRLIYSLMEAESRGWDVLADLAWRGRVA